MRNHFELNSRWDVRTGREELWDALEELLRGGDPMLWWPSVVVTSYDGEYVSLRARSLLGYALRFRLHGLVTHRPDTMSFCSDGDLRGSGLLDFSELAPDRSAIDIRWHVSLDHGWMRASSWILRPAFVLAHNLVMSQGEKNFNAWLARRATA